MPFNHSMDVSGRLKQFSSSSISLDFFLSIVSGRTCERQVSDICPNLMAPCWMEAPWLPTVLDNIVGRHSLVVPHCKTDVQSSNEMSMVRSYQIKQRWLLQVMCVNSSDSGGIYSSIYIKGLTSSVGRNGQVGVLNQGVPNNASHSASKLAQFLSTCIFRLAWPASNRTLVYISATFCFFGASSSSQGF